MRAKDAVGLADDEAKHLEDRLQRAHVGPVKMGHAQVEHAVAEREARIHQGRPRLLIDEIARRQPLGLPKHFDRIAGALEIRTVDGKFVAHDAQTSLHVFHGGTVIVAANRPHERLSSTGLRKSRPSKQAACVRDWRAERP